MLATNMPFILQRALVITTILLVVLHSIETCCGREPLDGFDEFAAKALDAFGTPGMSVAVVQDGKVVFMRGYGLRKLGEDATVDAQTVFHIASISKTFTATAIAILVDEGKLAWDDPVIKYVPEFQLSDPYRTREATVTDLLTHRLGIENDALVPARGDIDRPESIRRMRFLRPVAGFRSKYIYQDAAFVVLSEVVRQRQRPVLGRLREAASLPSTGNDIEFFGDQCAGQPQQSGHDVRAEFKANWKSIRASSTARRTLPGISSLNVPPRKAACMRVWKTWRGMWPCTLDMASMMAFAF